MTNHIRQRSKALPLEDDRRILISNLIEHRLRLQQIAAKILRDRCTAEDVVADVFVKIRTMASLLLPASNSEAWLCTVTRNLALDQLKYAQHYILTGTITAPAVSSEVNEDYRRIELELFLDAVLDEESKEIVLRKVKDGYTHREIAEMIGRPQGTVRRTYREALATLRKHKYSD